MSYYDNQWNTPSQSQNQSQSQSQSQNNWEHQGATTPTRAGASGPQAQDDYAFSYQFEEVDRAYENLQKSGKGFMMGGRRKFSPMHHGHGPGSARSTPDFNSRASHGSGSRQHSVNNFDDSRGPPGGGNLHNFYASQRHQPSRGSNEAEQVMQAKRRMAAQRERELRNLHTEQQFQRNGVADVPAPGPPTTSSNNPVNMNVNMNANMNANNKHMTEEQTRDLIARQRSALYGEGAFADKSAYIDETGNVRPGVPGPSGPSSLRGASPLTYDSMGRAPPMGDSGTPASAIDPMSAPMDPHSRPASTNSPQTGGPTNKVFDNAVGQQSRTSTSSPTGGSPPRDLAPGSKPKQSGASVAPIGTRPSGTPSSGSGSKRSTTPLTSGGGWGRGNAVWGQSSGLGNQASVWG